VNPGEILTFVSDGLEHFVETTISAGVREVLKVVTA